MSGSQQALDFIRIAGLLLVVLTSLSFLVQLAITVINIQINLSGLSKTHDLATWLKVHFSILALFLLAVICGVISRINPIISTPYIISLYVVVGSLAFEAFWLWRLRKKFFISTFNLIGDWFKKKAKDKSNMLSFSPFLLLITYSTFISEYLQLVIGFIFLVLLFISLAIIAWRTEKGWGNNKKT